MATRKIVKMIDIGANLTDPMFRGIYNERQRHKSDLDDMLKRARTAGIEKMIITGGSLSDSKAALDLALSHDDLYTTIGCHPTRCTEFDKHFDGPQAYLDNLEQLARGSLEKVVAVGELGLDYDRLYFCDASVQRKYFEMQLDLASSLKLPLFLHNRNSITDFVSILKKNSLKFQTYGGVVHSFDGSLVDLAQILDLGLYIGINGCSLKTQNNLDVVKQIPQDRLLIETDCPWCEIKRTHASYRHVKTIYDKCKDASNSNLPVKNRNEPMSLIQVLEVLAAVRCEEFDTLSRQVYENTNKLFFNKLGS